MNDSSDQGGFQMRMLARWAGPALIVSAVLLGGCTAGQVRDSYYNQNTTEGFEKARKGIFPAASRTGVLKAAGRVLVNRDISVNTETLNIGIITSGPFEDPKLGEVSLKAQTEEGPEIEMEGHTGSIRSTKLVWVVTEVREGRKMRLSDAEAETLTTDLNLDVLQQIRTETAQ
jgi:hypothetical protein